MYATAKHFPGHGDTGTDSHISLPIITANWSRLDSVELDNNILIRPLLEYTGPKDLEYTPIDKR
jgi:hypothetical protein